MGSALCVLLGWCARRGRSHRRISRNYPKVQHPWRSKV